MGDSPTLGRTDTRAWIKEEQESPVVPARLWHGACGRRRGQEGQGHDGAALPPNPQTHSPLARRTRSPPRSLDSTRADSSPPPPPPAHAPSPRLDASVGLGLGLPVELDELLEAGEAFAGLGAASSMSVIHRTLSASTASTTSRSSSSHPSSPRSGPHAGSAPTLGGAGPGTRARGARRSASTAATSVHGFEGDEGGFEKARSPAAASMPRTPSLAGSSPAGGDEVQLGLVPSGAAAQADFPSATHSSSPSAEAPIGRPSSARRPSTSSSTTTSPPASSSPSRSSPPSHTAHPSPSPRSSSTSPVPPAEHWHASWAPPADVDDEEQLVLGLLPILHPGAGLLEPEPAHEGATEQRELVWSESSEREWAFECRSVLGQAHGPPKPDTPAPAHPFSAPGVALRRTPTPPSSTSRSPSTSSLLAPPLEPPKHTKRTSVLSTLASPFAGLARSRSTGGGGSAAGTGLAPPHDGERASTYRLSVIGEASSSAHSGGSSSSSSAASLAPTSSGSSRRRLRRTSLSSSSGASQSQSQSRSGAEATVTETGSQVRYASAEAARDELDRMGGKAAKVLGLSVAAPAPADVRGEQEQEGRAAGGPSAAAVERPRSVRSSRSGGGDQEERGLSRWPARRDDIKPFELLSADMYKLGSPLTSRFRSGARTHFRPRFVALTASPHPPSPSPSSSPSYHLRAFVSRHPSERETYRLHLSPSSVVCVPSAAELPSRLKDGRAFAIKVTGHQEPTGDEGTTQAHAEGDSAWVLGLDDEGVFCEWLERLKGVVRDLRKRAERRRTSSSQGGHDDGAPFDLDITQRAADDEASLKSGDSGLGSLVLSAQGWQFELNQDDVDLRSRRPSAGRIEAASSSWSSRTHTTGSQPDDGASSRSGRRSLDDYLSAQYNAPATTSAAAGSSFLDADSSGDDSLVDDVAPSAARLASSLEARSKLSERAVEHSSLPPRGLVHLHAHLAPPRPPPSSALPPLPLEHGDSLSPSHLDSFRRQFRTSTTSLPSSRHARPDRTSYLSSHSSDSLPPPTPPPRSKLPALPPVPPSPDLAQLERELGRRAPSRTRSEHRA
ncbi:hypothetical protein JCM3775_002522 [Rhodotorula graminis]|uniref:PH domain-containing protein n=1 Tax=Rhodotorula graminis (strain WP1) TaxID=578459 RepID=A0A0P9EIE1_RHOGW|nr:uncharacterized protein RHOBADRAFT_55304 [Rhodotorula graminis WP1]KPV73071.1 hypothetical protein RHOBADRAFT_55304 [Rhodotorula graminis WP1]